MPKTRQQNPLYARGGYNNQAVGDIGNSIGAILLGGESPNEAAEREATAALREAQGYAAREGGRESGVKADIAGLTLADLLNIPETVTAQDAAMNALPQHLRPQAQTLYSRRVSDDPQKIDDARRLNTADAAMNLAGPDFAGPLGVAPEAVSTRQAALKGDDLFSVNDEGLLQKKEGTLTQTPGSRANIRKTDAEANKAVASSNPAQKPMPPSVLKQYNQSNESLKVSKEVQRRLDDANKLFSDERTDAEGKVIGPVDTGMVARGVRGVTKIVGGGTDNTRGLGELDRTREKIRADYMLLAKGVQTDRDANNAMNSMMPYTTDPLEIQQQIRDVGEATQALISLHMDNKQNIELEYGAPGGGKPSPVDAAPAAPAGRPPLSSFGSR